MRFSIRFVLLATTFCALTLAIGWPIYITNTKPFVVNAETSTAGSRLGWAEAPKLFHSTGNLAFICNEAYSEFVPYLDGKTLPYLIVLNTSNKEFEFGSRVRVDSKNLSAKSNVAFDQTEIRIEYQICDAANTNDPSSHPANAIEHLIVDDVTLDLNLGRLVTLDLIDGKYKTSQTKTSRIPAQVFRASYLDDKSLFKKILKWWSSIQSSLRQ